MRIQAPFPVAICRSARKRSGGFTLSEIMIATAVFMLVVTGILSAHLFGLRMFQVNQTKLTATEWSRRTFGKITAEIRACNSMSILNVDTNGNFTGLLDGEIQQGNALQIYPATNSDTYTIYFVNSADETFRRTEAMPGATNTFILADSVTNNLVFSAQDLSGNVLTNNLSNRMIHLALEFDQPASFMLDPYQYKLETSAKQRVVP